MSLPKKSQETKPHDRYRLVAEIVACSVAGTWDQAKREWELSHVYFAESPYTCLCGHRPIIECCVLRNRENGNEAVVGNVCVKRFVGLPSEPIFAGLRKIAKNRSAALSEAAVEFAAARGWLNDWERQFCLDTRGKPRHRLTKGQFAKRVEINTAVLRRATRVEGQCHAS
jgi:hypothetical protein